MSKFDASPLVNSYQYPRWPTPISRPHSSLPSKNINEMFKLGLENRNHTEFTSKSRLIRHNIYIPTDSRVLSPPLLYQPNSTPDLCSAVDQNSVVSSVSPTPTPIKSSAFNIPIKNPSGENSLKNFPKQSHERRKITQERKRQKQLALKHAHGDAGHWFELRQSLAELKRLAATEEILVDPTTSLFHCDGYSFDALKQAIREQEQKKINRFKSESGLSSSMDTLRSFNIRSRTSLTASRNSFSRPQLPRQSTETYVRPTFEPLFVAAKPLHPLLLNGNNHSTKIRPRPQSRTRLTREEKRLLCTSSNLSNNDDIPISFTPSPTLQDTKEDESEQHEPMKLPQISFPSDQPRPSIKSAIKLKSSIPRCRSANDGKQNLTLNKNYPRFIIITDQEHRIESWYHQYPFIVSDELIQTFQTKPNKTTVSAYFIDEQQQQQNKTHLQGKPFHINNDWKKYDLIFISNNIYHDIMIYLQTIIKLSGKLIHIYQINHNEDLKTQVKFILKQFNQQVTSHV